MRLALALALFLAPGLAAADALMGLWQTQPDDDGRVGHVEFAPCGAAICGTLVGGADAQGSASRSDLIGRQIVWGMTATGGGSYGGGKIWAPDRDKTYNSKMTLEGDRLKVSGCVLGICRSQTWTRLR